MSDHPIRPSRPPRPRPSPAWGAAALLLFASAGCADSADPDGGATIEVRAAPLGLSGIDFACYDLRVTNGSGEVVVALGDPGSSLLSEPPDTGALCSHRFGDGAGGGIAYVAPCDASDPNHTVTLWVDGLYRGTPASPQAVSYQDPCPGGCSLPVVCEANADAPVTFNLTVLRPAEQGFLDVAVNFRDVHCAAKVDCVDSSDAALELLFHPTTGQRAQTAVVALACAGGLHGAADGATVLLRDPIVITCPGHESVVLDPALGPGNVYGAAHPNPDPDGPVWQYATYAGSSAVDCAGGACDMLYWNVAIGFHPDVAGCTLTAGAAAGGVDLLPGYATPAATVWPWIAHEVALTGPTGGTSCTRHPLNGAPAGVETRYTAIDAPATFCHRYTAAAGLTSAPEPGCGLPEDDPLPPGPCQPEDAIWPGDLHIGDPEDVPINLDCVEIITGGLTLEDDAPDLTFPLLQQIGTDSSGGLTLRNYGNGDLRTVAFPNLELLWGDLSIDYADTFDVAWPVLGEVAGVVTVTSLSDHLSLGFPSLTDLDHLVLADNSGSLVLTFDAPIVVGDMLVETSTEPTTVTFRSAVQSGGRVLVAENSGSVELRFEGDLAVDSYLHLNNNKAAVDVDIAGELAVDELSVFGNEGDVSVRASALDVDMEMDLAHNEAAVDVDVAGELAVGALAVLANEGDVSVRVSALDVEGVVAIRENDGDVAVAALGSTSPSWVAGAVTLEENWGSVDLEASSIDFDSLDLNDPGGVTELRVTGPAWVDGSIRAMGSADQITLHFGDNLSLGGDLEVDTTTASYDLVVTVLGDLAAGGGFLLDHLDGDFTFQVDGATTLGSFTLDSVERAWLSFGDAVSIAGAFQFLSTLGYLQVTFDGPLDVGGDLRFEWSDGATTVTFAGEVDVGGDLELEDVGGAISFVAQNRFEATGRLGVGGGGHNDSDMQLTFAQDATFSGGIHIDSLTADDLTVAFEGDLTAHYIFLSDLDQTAQVLFTVDGEATLGPAGGGHVALEVAHTENATIIMSGGVAIDGTLSVAGNHSLTLSLAGVTLDRLASIWDNWDSALSVAFAALAPSLTDPITVRENEGTEVTLSGFESLSVDIEVQDNRELALRLPDLVTLAADLGIVGNEFDVLELPLLASAERVEISNNDGLSDIAFAALVVIDELSMDSNLDLETLEAPSLVSADVIVIGDNHDQLDWVAFPALVTATRIEIRGNDALTDLDLRSLEEVDELILDDNGALEDHGLLVGPDATGDLYATNNTMLSTCFLQALAAAMGMSPPFDTISGNYDDADECPATPALQCPIWEGDLVIDDAEEIPGGLHCLEEITGDLVVQNTDDALQLAFPVLEVVGGAIIFEDTWEPVTVTMGRPLVASSLQIRTVTGIDLEFEDDLTLTGDLQIFEHSTDHSASSHSTVRVVGDVTVGGTLSIEENWDDLLFEVLGAFDAETIEVRNSDYWTVELRFGTTVQVSEDVTIRDNYGSWIILDAVELTVGGALAIHDNTLLEVDATVSDDASLGALEIQSNTGSFSGTYPTRVYLAFPSGWELATAQNVLIRWNEELELTLTGVEAIDDTIWFHDNTGSRLIAPDLERLYVLTVQDLVGPEEPFDLPSLTTAGAIQTQGTQGVEVFAFPMLASTTHPLSTNLVFDDHEDLDRVLLPELTTAGTITFSYNPSLTEIDLGSLESLTGQGLSLQGNTDLEASGLHIGALTSGSLAAEENTALSTCFLLAVAHDQLNMTWTTFDDFPDNLDDTGDCPEYGE